MMATTLLLQGQQCQLDDYASLTMAETPSIKGNNCHCDDGKDACASTATMPSQQGQQCYDDGKYTCASLMTTMTFGGGQWHQLEDSNAAIAMRATIPLRIKGNSAIITRVTTPAQQWQGRLRIDNGNNATVMREHIWNCDNRKDACALTAMTPSWWGQQRQLENKQWGQQCWLYHTRDTCTLTTATMPSWW
jgi:hypothetical protein